MRATQFIAAAMVMSVTVFASNPGRNTSVPSHAGKGAQAPRVRSFTEAPRADIVRDMEALRASFKSLGLPDANIDAYLKLEEDLRKNPTDEKLIAEVARLHGTLKTAAAARGAKLPATFVSTGKALSERSQNNSLADLRGLVNEINADSKYKALPPQILAALSARATGELAGIPVSATFVKNFKERTLPQIMETLDNQKGLKGADREHYVRVLSSKLQYGKDVDSHMAQLGGYLKEKARPRSEGEASLVSLEVMADITKAHNGFYKQHLADTEKVLGPGTKQAMDEAQARAAKDVTAYILGEATSKPGPKQRGIGKGTKDTVKDLCTGDCAKDFMACGA